MQLAKIFVGAQDNLKMTVDPKFNLQFDEHTTHCSQCRGATTSFPLKSTRLPRLLQEQNKHDELVSELCSAEKSHENEQKKNENLVQEVAEFEPLHVNGYVSETVSFYQFGETSMSAANISISHCNIALRKLMPIAFTTLSDIEFLGPARVVGRGNL